jgi:hypothetical protein
MLDIILCCGNKIEAPTIASKSGMKYGIRSDHKPYSSDIYMLDINWEKYDWIECIKKINQYKPTIAMVPDYIAKDQYTCLHERIWELKSLGIQRVMVCPKFKGAVEDIPNDCIVAVSVPTKYAGYLPDREELLGRRIHLLGGVPDQQLYLMRKYNHGRSEVISVDGNRFLLDGRWGKLWSPTKPGWKKANGLHITTVNIQIQSARNIVKYLTSPDSIIRMNKPVSKCMTEEERNKYGFRDIISCCSTE